MSNIVSISRQAWTATFLRQMAIWNLAKDKGFDNLYIDGGKTIQSFLEEDLIDELIAVEAVGDITP